VIFFFFFFSSRRRHTRCLSDWSSDVCSSDLSKLVSSQFCFVVISSSNHSKVLPLIHPLKCPIALSLPAGGPARLSFGSIPRLCKSSLSCARKSGILSSQSKYG